MQTKEIKLISYSELPPRVALTWGMLEAIREQTLEFVEGLSEEELSKPAVPAANTIGTLLAHIAAAELYWIKEVILGKPLTGEEEKEFNWESYETAAGWQVDPAPLEIFAEKLSQVRRLTGETISKIKDSDLDSVRFRESNGKKQKISVGWILYHLVEHEAGHQGQIAMLKRLIREKDDNKG